MAKPGLIQALQDAKIRRQVIGTPASGPAWITDQLPDADMTVLMRLAGEEFPIWPGFHDGEGWRSADASTVEGPVLGWMELETAAQLLGTP